MLDINAVTKISISGKVATIIIDSPPVNALSVDVRNGLIAGMARATAIEQVSAIVVACAGRTFFAGFDIAELDAGIQSPTLVEVLTSIESSSKPVVAAIHGSALGGGLELALACHARIVVSSAVLGLPEVHLGLLPGAGGTQRLPRVIGVPKSLDMMVFGKPLKAEAARKAGLIDTIAAEDDLQGSAVEFATQIIEQKRSIIAVRDRDDLLEEARQDADLFNRFRANNPATFRGFRAPESIVRAIEAAVTLPFEQGAAEEGRLFDDLYRSEESAAQRYSFFSQREAAKLPRAVAGMAEIPIATVGIVGGHRRTAEIAARVLASLIPVTLVDCDQAALDESLASVRDALRRVIGGQSDAEATCNSMLVGSLDIGRFTNVDLIIDGGSKSGESRLALFRELGDVVSGDTVLATTDNFPEIDVLSEAARSSGRVFGLNFFFQSWAPRLVEVVRSDQTKPSVLAAAMKLIKKVSGVPVLAKNTPGLIAGRIIATRSRECDYLLLDGALPRVVDRVLVQYGMPVGEFELRDLVGIAEYAENANFASVLLANARSGASTQAGYYDYGDNGRPSNSENVERMLNDYCKRLGRRRPTLSDEEILERCSLSVLNECAEILLEKVTTRPSDIDIALQFGYGWPSYRGGPIFEADRAGIRNVLDRLRNLEGAVGDRFRPATLIRELAENEEAFSRLASAI
jgi:3-hydroxyacyl-CoA dehydrogenase